ncbi:sigma 54-interacting transcriptional regulator [Thalassotalea euphylliae]|uniref:sigma 54-interacting transcriptional regulator n=1 Tax=Thalassotalea euphylliae TaxID=1655234 RepID=UPI0036414814
MHSVANQAWDVLALEVVSQALYLHLQGPKSVDSVSAALEGIAGIKRIEVIELLPTESREQHLDALLRRLPDPIFDLDKDGKVISTNQLEATFIGRSIANFTSLSLRDIKTSSATSIEVSYQDKHYFGDISPLWVEGTFQGAVLLLRSPNALGRHITALQSEHKIVNIDDIVGDSAPIKAIKQQAARLAQLDMPVFIAGETGTGKELFARAIHASSQRKNAPFLAINCASLSEQLLESELFGYASGAFTGAQASGKPGLFELADGGTVFLDEVAEMSVYLQAKLLRFLQDYRFRRLGSTKELFANIRIISATHQPLDKLVQEKGFREDLFYRLNVLNLSIPALRQRKEDIAELCYYFIENAAAQVNQNIPDVSSDAIACLCNYAWPGNVRQLQNVMFRLVALLEGSEIELSDVNKALSSIEVDSIIDNETPLAGLNFEGVNSWSEAQEIFEKQLIESFWPKYPSTRKLAERLKVSHNKIAMKLRQYKSL